VRRYASLAAPLTDLLRSTTFQWGSGVDSTFTELKQKITSAPILTLPDFSKDFIVETDASAVTVGAVLSQSGHSLAFFSKKLCPRMQAASTYVREMYAITEAIKKMASVPSGQKVHHIHRSKKS
jgi:hypothetical protein